MTVEAAENTVELPANWKDLIVTSSSGVVTPSTDTSDGTYPTLTFTYLNRDNKIMFMKYLRMYTGLGLAEAKTIADNLADGQYQIVVANPSSDTDASTALAQFEALASDGALDYTTGDASASLEVIYPSITITSYDASINKTDLIKELLKYNIDLSLKEAKNIIDKVLYDNEPQTIEANNKSFTVLNTVLAQLEVWAQEGKLVYNINGDIPQIGRLDPLFIIKTIKFSNDIVPTNVKKMATDLYYTLDETTGELLFYASDSKTIIAPKNSRALFQDLTSLTSIDFTNFSTKGVTNMGSMFFGCKLLSAIDLSNFDTKDVTDMSGMFFDCRSLESLDLTLFDTSNVSDMSYMFYGCKALESLDLTLFDTSKVTDMNHMFNECSVLTNLDLRSFDTNSVVNMHSMFENCKQMIEIKVSDKFSTANVTDITRMFYNCGVKKLTLSNFDFSNVTDADNALPTGSNISADLSNVDLSNTVIRNVVSRFVTENTFEDLNLTGCDLEHLSEAMEEGSSIDAKSITLDTDKIGEADIALKNSLYNDGVEYSNIDSSIASAKKGTIKLTSDGTVPSTGVVSESVLPAIIALAVLVSLAIATITIKKKNKTY